MPKNFETAEYSKVIDRIYDEVLPFRGKGKVADYIPALSEVDPRQRSEEHTSELQSR